MPTMTLLADFWTDAVNQAAVDTAAGARARTVARFDNFAPAFDERRCRGGHFGRCCRSLVVHPWALTKRVAFEMRS